MIFPTKNKQILIPQVSIYQPPSSNIQPEPTNYLFPPSTDLIKHHQVVSILLYPLFDFIALLLIFQFFHNTIDILLLLFYTPIGLFISAIRFFGIVNMESVLLFGSVCVILKLAFALSLGSDRG